MKKYQFECPACHHHEAKYLLALQCTWLTVDASKLDPDEDHDFIMTCCDECGAHECDEDVYGGEGYDAMDKLAGLVCQNCHAHWPNIDQAKKDGIFKLIEE